MRDDYKRTPAQNRAEAVLDAHGVPRDDRVTAKAPPRSFEKIEAIIRDVQLANAEAEADE